MSLILRAQVAAAAHDIVPAWPLDSFIAVNPLAGRESYPFETETTAEAATTRPGSAYLADYQRGRITRDDIDAALLERIPQLADRRLRIGTAAVSAVRVAELDMRLVAAAPAPEPVAVAELTWLDEYLAVWVAGYLCPDPAWPMPHHADGFYRAWRTLACLDPSLPRTVRRTLTTLSPEPDAALAHALQCLGIAAADVPRALRTALGHLPGWVGHIKWRAEKVGDIDLTSYLAVRFTVQVALGITPAADQTTQTAQPDHTTLTSAPFWLRAERVAQALTAARPSREDVAAVARVLSTHPITDQRYTWQKAYELNYRTALIGALRSTVETRDGRNVQLVMCIDPRSEGLRRHLEESSSVETFGFAGFFGVPIRFARYQARGAIDSLPALLSARHHITEIPVDHEQAHRVVAAGKFRDALRHAVHTADSTAATPFAFAETAGWFYGGISILRTLTPRIHARIVRALSLSSRDLRSDVTIADAFTLDERATLAETALRMMGLAQFAPLVVLAGHGSESENNLYQSALDCGACGGNPGHANARAAAAIFNDPEVRLLLADRGLPIPFDTFFVAAEHNTVSDMVTVLDRHLIPDSHTSSADRFEQLQRTAADKLVTERARQLPGASPRHSPARLRGRAHDWAEVYPELGLAGNATMIIGPRDMTRNVDLGRRVFLHSYRTELDPTGAALETIMTAPLVVAQWINHQYYFTALNPDTLGAGTKTIHNAIGTLGVISGHSGDLRRGLPWQSVGLGTELFHEPMRLTVVVEAPLARIGEIISRNQVLRDLFDNDWITLTARDHPTALWHRYTAYGFTATATATPAATATPMEGPHP
ncbi:DUF2309 domain-containing protein [Cryobacterium sp. TMT2-42-4]|uniref:DUF2309 domain-containing protein n=1 Tax=Cryobacterium sp. TMT2-42-4 TaxID=1259255 RepID=UPI0010699F3E|nr:DUF2309 domain-containing protein [Cryobacterium sp. TMT2-42-4]TFC38669.1 DUF2309 domain-containing protein [Cryobacterium sp. TMT2-42-4]